MSSAGRSADDLGGMSSTTAPEPGRGNGHARLLADLAALERLAEERPPVAARLREALGHELAHKLVFALTSRGRVAVEAAAADAA
jgi:hypothetical protein